ncbi:anaerobic ribonucleoside-triphosphate reductase activating protein [Methanobrevibacter sp. DSM 116169]|uniref:anaerobic ribonucleoside-triphosphate reductase activating protein n=1 Tax=Methanobrevibacter sp. DSM 116169 TaxID=3242727 RepID=UPI0038FCC9D3
MLIGGTIISSIELHGQMSLVIFFAKCPLRCPYCHNKDILEDGEEMSFNDIKKIIDDSSDFIDAVVITGGEPLMQLDDVTDVLKYIKSLNLKTKIDTSGVYPKRIEKLLKMNLLDYISLDIKAPFNKYEKVIGSSVGEQVKKSMEIINSYNTVKLELRTTYVPNLLNEEDIKTISQSVKGDIYTLQQFRSKSVLDESFEEVESPNPNELKKIASSLDFKGTIKVKSSEFGEETVKE